jgi:hypothetical protein
MENIIDDVCASIEAWRLEEPKHESFCEGIASSALRALNSYIDVGNEKALQGAIYLSVAAVGCSTSNHPDRARIVSICHQVFYNKYLLRRDPRDIQCALRLLFEGVKLHSVGDKALLGPYASISGLYIERFNRWRRDEDLKKAALYGAKAVKLFPPGVSNGAYQLYLVALGLMQAYESNGSERSLCNAITQMGAAIAASYQVQDRIEFDYMNAYANMLSIRSGRSYGSHHDIEAALYWARKAYEGADATSPLKPIYAQNLSNRYYQRYKRKTKSLWDLDRSIELMRSLPTRDLDVGERSSSLALELLDRYQDFGDAAALTEAVRIGRSMVQGYFSNDLINRSKVEHIAALCLEALYEYNHEAAVLEEALRHARRAVTFSPTRKGTSGDFSDTLNRLTRIKEEAEP